MEIVGKEIRKYIEQYTAELSSEEPTLRWRSACGKGREGASGTETEVQLLIQSQIKPELILWGVLENEIMTSQVTWQGKRAKPSYA